MNPTRNLAKSLNQSVSMFRCSRLSVRALSTTRSVVKNRLFQKCAGSLDVSRSKLLSHVMRPMSSSTQFEVINVQDEEDFMKRVIEASNSTPVVVDFHATWCGPCKILGPRLESLLSKEEGKVMMAKVDIDDHPEIAMEYGVRSVPTVVGLKNGKIQNQFIGVKDDDQISTFVDTLVVS